MADEPSPFPSRFRRAGLMLSSSVLHGRLADIPGDLLEGLTDEDAYEIQHANATRWIEAGQEHIGYGCSVVTTVHQEALGIDYPLYGHLFKDNIAPPNTVLAMNTMHNPHIQAVLIATFALDVEPKNCNANTVRVAIDAVYPGIEIMDSRFEQANQLIPIRIMDQAWVKYVVRGNRGQAATKIDLKTLVGTLTANDEPLAEGSGRSILGDPYEAAAWLSQRLVERDIIIRAGQTVVLGNCTMAVPLAPQTKYEATFKSLGSVTIQTGPAD